MIFLVTFNREAGVVVKRRAFSSTERQDAEAARLALDFEARANNSPYEIVLIEAESEDIVRQTHARYFGGLDSPHTLHHLLD